MIKCITLVFVFLVRKKTGKKNVDGFSITSCSRSLFSKSSSSIVEDRIWLFMTSISTWNLNSTFPSFFAWRNVSLDSLFYHSYIFGIIITGQPSCRFMKLCNKFQVILFYQNLFDFTKGSKIFVTSLIIGHSIIPTINICYQKIETWKKKLRYTQIKKKWKHSSIKMFNDES